MSHGVQRLLRIGRNTRDLDRALAFYQDALGFTIRNANAASPTWTRLPGMRATPARCARLVLGAQEIELTEFPDAAPYAAGGTACDLGFQHCAIVTSDMDAAYARLMRNGATPITQGGPQRLPPSTGSVTAFKFRDPDGHPLELIAFPAGTGDPCWQSAHNAPAVGIDHSAISVGDVERSVRFYELLGLHVASRGVNCGVEQQRLDDLANVVVDVTAMQAQAPTPHLELLGYRKPRGRPSPVSETGAVASDRLVWQARGIDVLLDTATDAGFASGVADGTTVAMLCDPDGHLLVLTTADA